MSNEIPVCDVLLEAAEYLCKLGTNLRTRSQNLKEKRFRRDKLRNTHAIQKAADKLLLICDLSKKSLSNVEAGVNKILSVCGVSANRRALSPVEVISPRSSKKHYYYFEYDSCKLRISQKVSLKHYMSVKVIVDNLPSSIQDNYPVYHDCNLYRLRKKIQMGKLSSEAVCSDSDSVITSDHIVATEAQDNLHLNEPSDSVILENNKVHSFSSASALSQDCKKDNLSISDARPSINEVQTDNSTLPTNISDHNVDEECNKNYSIVQEVQTVNNPLPTTISNNNVNEESNNNYSSVQDRTDNNPLPSIICSYNVCQESNINDSNVQEIETGGSPLPTISTDEINNEICNRNDSSVQEVQTEKSLLPTNSSPIMVEDSGHGEVNKDYTKCNITDSELNTEITNSDKKFEDETVSKLKNNGNLNVSCQNGSVLNKTPFESKENSESSKSHSSISTTKHKEIKTKKITNSKKFKKIQVIDDSSASSDDTTKKTEDLQNWKSESQLEKSTCEQQQTSLNSNNEEQKSLNMNAKPLLKCVDISKLLKPEIVSKNRDNIDEKKCSYKVIKQKVCFVDSGDIEDNVQNKLKKKAIQDQNNEEEIYWKQKRIEAKSFKPKIFSIPIARLPQFSNEYLVIHNLKRIIHSEAIIAEIKVKPPFQVERAISGVDESSKPIEITSSPENSDLLQKDDIYQPDVLKAKHALLDDSDSDKLSSHSSPRDNNVDYNTCDITETNHVLETTASNESHKPIEDDRSKEIREEHKTKRITPETRDEPTESDKNQSDISNLSEHNSNSKFDNMQNKNDHVLKSDSESNKQDQSGKNSSNNLKDTVSNDSFQITTSEQQKTNSVVEEDNNKINSELLNNSSDSLPKTPKHNRKKSKSTTPQSKRKHIMESMHAKKMLLTYSSSSDTEDEQLKKVLKDIKQSLLQGSDEESNTVKEQIKEVHKRKLLASSSSDEEDIVINPKKKLKKVNKSSSDEGDTRKKKSNDTSNRPVDENEEHSSSSSKMGRSRVKASGSQISDTQDSDKDIDGLTNLKSLNKTTNNREQTSNSSVQPEGRPRREKKMPQISALTEEPLPEESNSSEEETDPENGDAEELPPVAVSSLNGGALQHLAKEELLEESDSSTSVNKSSEDTKKEDESGDEENLKRKRRKANAISSDSEGGTNKKNSESKLTDFEDSEDESSEPIKKNKRKKKTSDSDGSGGSSDEMEKKKRRRIKQLDDSEGSGSESENEGKKHGRKNIRKVMGKDQLEEATKRAARREKERMARIAERQKLYNNLQFDESGKPDEVVLDKVVLDFDPETKEPLIQVDRGLVKKLKPHQANGIKFMWDACFESAKRIKKDKGSGCILAHCMGLGKTLQVVSLTHTLLTHGDLTGVNRVLVVCPLSTVLNWVNEFNMWLKHAETEYDVDVYELSRYKQNSERAFQLQQWYNGGGVCVLGYEMFRNLSADNPKKFRKKMLKSFQESLVDPGPDLVVCDEGHLLKNEKTSLSQSMNRVKTLRRIVLTGTPLQNNLKEYYCMVQFVKPNLLGKYNEYLNRFVNPITNGQYTDSTEQDIRVMKRRSHVLHKMLDGAVQRRDYGVLAPFLPPKHEYVLFITLSEVQTKLYQHYLENYSRRPLPGKSSGFLFPDFQSLQRIWTHPLVLKYNSERYEIMQQKKREREEEEDSEGSLADFIDDESTGEETTSEETSDDDSDASDDSRKKSKKKKGKKSKGKDSKASTRRGTRANPVEIDPEEKMSSDIEEVKNDNPTEWWIKLVSDDEIEDLRNSHKLVLLFDILRQCEAIGDKLLVFSQSLYSLDLIEHFLGKIDEATQEGRIDEKLGKHVGSWSPGIDYFRLDGSTSCENRSIWCKNFNKEDNPRARLFLISTRAGGLGINLVAANRVVIFDVSWNPSHDVQSIFRVYRFGQKKPCYVYRFLAMGTMEEKIYERQVTKQAISKRVIDEQQIDRHYAENDLAELYKFEPKPPEPRPIPPLPKDRLFAEMLKEHDKQIYKYHEHDSLLENKEEETLTEEERKAAWEDFENEKNRPPPAPFPSVWPMHNGMAPSLIAQQQQQLAYAAVAAMLRKDMPNVNENQIRDMLPMIYNANPAMFGGYDYGLMQKMSELYKYAQPGMVNPMLNPMAAGGGSSGLQYEPPWQRQQQQQQQMRLQQLMQQQSQMGAKYYAGGLGSRDPMAMALQQQRAREMMLGERARGRPRLQQPTDVVNIDSD